MEAVKRAYSVITLRSGHRLDLAHLPLCIQDLRVQGLRLHQGQGEGLGLGLDGRQIQNFRLDRDPSVQI